MPSDEHKRKRSIRLVNFRADTKRRANITGLYCYCHLFPALKKYFEGMHFTDDEEVTVAVNKFLRKAAGE